MAEPAVALLLFPFALAFSAGPGNMVFAANGARFGTRATKSAYVGCHLAALMANAAIGLGFVTAFDHFPQVFALLKIGGSPFLPWLAWKMFHSSTVKSHSAAQPIGFIDRVVLLLLNPKGYFIIALMFTLFATSGGLCRLATVLLITMVFTANYMVAFTLWPMAGDRMARQFRSA